MYYPWQLLCFTAVILTADKDKHSMLGETGIQIKRWPPITIPSVFYIYMFLIFYNVKECVTESGVYY